MIPPPKITLRAFIDPSRGFTICLWGQARSESGPLAWAKPVVFEERSRGEAGFHHQPMLDLEPEEAQVLVDSLWDAGVRPTAAKGSAGQLAAVQAHLDDLRRYLDKVLYRMVEKAQ